MKNIILTGFMGTGKSTVGRCLANKLSVRFVDTDNLIEKEAGINTAQIFAQFGEMYFRELETKIVNELSSKTDIVIATGGGTIVNPLNFEIFKKNGIIICLTASISAIIDRVGKGDERPLIMGNDIRDIVSNLLHIREPFYKKADFMIDTTAKSIKEVVEEILKIVR